MLWQTWGGTNAINSTPNHSVQFSSVDQSFPTLCDPMDCSMPGLPVHPNSQSLLKLMSIESVMPSNHLILCHPLLLLPSILPSIRVFPMSQFFTSSGQSIGVSASASVLPMSIQDWFPLGWTGWISLQSKRLLRVFSNTTVQKHQFFGTHYYFKQFYLFTYFWLLWVFVAACRPCLVAESRSYSMVAVPMLLFEVASLVKHGL